MTLVMASLGIIVLCTIVGDSLGSALIGCWAGVAVVMSLVCVLGSDE